MSATSLAIGTELYLRRLAAGIPVGSVAHKVGLSPSFLSVIEANHREPPIRLADEIRQAILELSGGYWDPFTDEYLAVPG